MNRRFTKEKADTLATLGLFIVALLLYLRTLAPSVATIYDDSLEFPLVVHRLAIAHPTGYPLYILLGKLFSFLPVGDAAYRINLLSAVCAAGAVAALYVLARRIGLHPLAGAAAALALCVSPVFWSQAVVAEVYALNALFTAVCLALAVVWAADAARPLRLLALLFLALGLSLTHHRMMLLLVPLLVLYLLLEGWKPWRGVKRTLALLVIFCLPFLLYLYLPLRGMVTSSLDGTYQNTLQGFVSWVSAGSYTTFLRDNPLQTEALGPAAYLRLLQEQLGAWGVALAVLGALWLALRKVRVFVLLALYWLAVVVFVYLYRVPDAPVFLIPSFLVMALAVGAGVHALAVARVPLNDLAPARLRGLTIPRLDQARLLLTGAVLLATLAPVLQGSYQRNDRSNDWSVHNYAMDALSQPLEQGGSIVGILGEMTLLRYFQETAGLRADLVTIAADNEAARLAAADMLLASGRTVYLTRALRGIEKSASLSAVGPLLQARPRSVAAPAMQPGTTALRADFGGLVTLSGYHVAGLASPLARQEFAGAEQAGGVEAGGRLRLTLYWQAPQPLPKDYRVTVRLLTPTGRLLWQTDAGPVHDGYAMTTWQAGETVADTYDLLVPVGTAPGSCDLQIGLYDAATLQPLPVAGKDSLLTIGPVAVVRPDKLIDLGSLARFPTLAPGLRIPGGQFDLSLQRLGITQVSHSNLQNEVELYGFGLSPRALKPGQSVDVVFLWQALRDLSDDRVVFVQLMDKSGQVWAAQQSQPGDGVYSTRDWRRGEVVRDVHSLMVPADAPDGEYRLQAGMYDPLGNPLTVLQLTRRSLDHVDLGTVHVRGRTRTTTLPKTRFEFRGQLGDVAHLMGYDLAINDAARLQTPPAVTARPGDTLLLTLVWQAGETTRTSYTVFVHLLSPQGIVVSQDDALPGRGAMPTTSWVHGEVISDAYALPIPPGARSGDYVIEVGMYDAATSARLPTWAGSGESTGGRFLLTKVRVENSP